MAKNKKSFLLYCDIIHTVEHLSNQRAGLLFKTILRYVNDEHPTVKDDVVKIAFEPIKRQLKRDLVKYEDKLTKWSNAGKRSAEVRNANKREQTLTDVTKRSTFLTDTDNDTDKYNVFIEEIKKSQWLESLYLLFKLKKGSISKLIDKFLLHLQTEEKKHTNISEFKKHFKNWLVILDRNNDLNEFKINKNRKGML